MREIKFRKFDTRINEMSEFEPYADAPVMAGDIKEVVLMQYTGLKDKSGKEIYEGDIVKITEDILPSSYLAQVNYWNGKYQYVSIEKDNWFDDLYKADCEVIGNIYQHPHILK